MPQILLCWALWDGWWQCICNSWCTREMLRGQLTRLGGLFTASEKKGSRSTHVLPVPWLLSLDSQGLWFGGSGKFSELWACIASFYGIFDGKRVGVERGYSQGAPTAKFRPVNSKVQSFNPAGGVDASSYVPITYIYSQGAPTAKGNVAVIRPSLISTWTNSETCREKRGRSDTVSKGPPGKKKRK